MRITRLVLILAAGSMAACGSAQLRSGRPLPPAPVIPAARVDLLPPAPVLPAPTFGPLARTTTAVPTG